MYQMCVVYGLKLNALYYSSELNSVEY